MPAQYGYGIGPHGTSINVGASTANASRSCASSSSAVVARAPRTPNVLARVVKSGFDLDEEPSPTGVFLRRSPLVAWLGLLASRDTPLRTPTCASTASVTSRAILEAATTSLAMSTAVSARSNVRSRYSRSTARAIGSPQLRRKPSSIGNQRTAHADTRWLVHDDLLSRITRSGTGVSVSRPGLCRPWWRAHPRLTLGITASCARAEAPRGITRRSA